MRLADWVIAWERRHPADRMPVLPVRNMSYFSEAA